MSNEDMNPRRPLAREEKKRVGIFEPFKFGKLPGFWIYLIGSIVLTGAAVIGGAWLLMKMGIS